MNKELRVPTLGMWLLVAFFGLGLLFGNASCKLCSIAAYGGFYLSLFLATVVTVSMLGQKGDD